MSQNTPKIQSTHPMGPDGVIRCHHGEQVEKFVSQTPRNPGREFFVCSRPQPERCKFWLWADDPIFKKPPPQTPPPQVAPSNTFGTTRPSPLHFIATPQSTPAKRTRPEASAAEPRAFQTPSSNRTSADTPSKKARLAAIQAGLQARDRDESPYQLPPDPEQSDVLPFTHGVESSQDPPAPSPASEVGTDVGQEVGPSRVRYSFLGLPPPTQESDSGTEPSTPKKRPSPIVDTKQDHHGETSSSALLTPPQSMKRTHGSRIETFASTPSGSASSRPEPVTPTRHKGKERASTQWDQPAEADENPFLDTTQSFKSKLESDFSRSRSPRSSLDSQSPSCTPTTGERITTHMRGMRDTIDMLRTYAEHLDQLDAHRYIERLERQKSALELGEEAKKRHIAALVAERDELKEKLGVCEERCRAKDQIIAGFMALR